MEKAQATDYLTNLLNKTLRITTTDTRLFIGEFKCTDSNLNIILAHTHEYRKPASIITSTTPSIAQPTTTQPTSQPDNPKATVKIPYTSRYLGLIVVPGEHITKIEIEEFASQAKGKTAG